MTQTTRITTPPLHLVPASAATHATSFQGHTLIVPTVSFASVPQLAVDLLLYDESLQLDKAGAIDTCGDLIPFVGPSDSKRGKAASGLITTPLEVYTNSKLKLTVLQQRSPVLRSRKRHFVAALASWIQSQGFAAIIVLSTLDASLRNDIHLAEGAPALFYVGGPPKTSSSKSHPQGVGITSINFVEQLQSQLPALEIEGSALGAPNDVKAKPTLPHLPRSSTGLLRPLLLALAPSTSSSSTSSQSLGLVLWAAEGDNRPDAHFLASLLRDQLLSEPSGQGPMVEPPSWQGLFGSSPDQALFG